MRFPTFLCLKAEFVELENIQHACANATEQAFAIKDLVDLVLQNFFIAFSGLRGGGEFDDSKPAEGFLRGCLYTLCPL